MTTLRPLRDHIVIRPSPVPEMSAGGIYIGQLVDDGAVKELVDGTIVAVGPGLQNSDGRRVTMWDLNPGDRVRYSPVCGVRQMVDGEELVITRRDAVAGVMS